METKTAKNEDTRHKPSKEVRFRLKEICHYQGREKDKTVERGYLDPIREEDLLHIIVAHKVLAELVEDGLLIPEIGRNNVETYIPVIAGKEKQWRRMVGPRGKWKHRFLMSWRWIKERFWLFLSWFFTIVAAAVVKKIMFD